MTSQENGRRVIFVLSPSKAAWRQIHSTASLYWRHTFSSVCIRHSQYNETASPRGVLLLTCDCFSVREFCVFSFTFFLIFFYTFNPLLINYLNVLSPSSLLCSLFWDVTLCTYVHCNAWCYDDLVIPSQPPPFITLAPLWRTRACRHHQDTPKKKKNKEKQEENQKNPKKKKKKKHPEESCIRAHSHFYPPICAQLTFTFSSSGLPGRDFCEEKACEVRQGKSH